MSTSDPPCPLCRSPRTALLFRKQQTAYRGCADCRFRFATPTVNPNLAQTLDQYEDAYLQYLAPDASDAANLGSLCQWMERFAPLGGSRLLDIGAGSGKLVRFLRARGVDAQGIEPSRALFDCFLSAETAFTCAMLDDLRSPAGGPFDVVTAFDVIEHVADPVRFLGDLSALLAPGGLFLGSTPDVGSLVARTFGRRWHFYYPYHLSYFAPRTLARAAEPHGLRLLDCRHRGRVRSVGYMVRYAAEFIGNATPPAWARRFDDWYVAVNLYDTMYFAFRRGRSGSA
jgi:2-polyprenyl-3-methyl-5-hydroxy-6-metoxy-1,4-benzoquinol methylase